MNWQQYANCAGVPDEMFPDKGGSTQYVRRLCAACYVRDECLAFALDNNIAAGIWGGLTPSQRVKLRREARQDA